MSNMLFGRYIPISSCIHKIDPRIKLIAYIVFFVALFLNYGSNFQNYIMFAIFFILLMIVVFIGKVSIWSIFKSIKAIWLMMILLLIVNMFFTQQGNIWFTIAGFDFYDEAFYRTFYIVFRLILMIMLTSILTATTQPMELTFAMEWVLTPLGFCNTMRVLIHVFAMTISLALRFIPSLADDASRIMQAQASRGVDFKNGKLKDRIKGLISLVIPLFVSCLSRSSDLADAMDARGYDPLAKRTRYNKRKWSISNSISCVVLVLFLAGMIVLSVYQLDFVDMILGVING